MTFTAARTAEFTAMIAMYPYVLSVGTTEYDCVVNATEIERAMQPSAYQPDRTATFRMWKTDFLAAGLDNRKAFTFEGKSFEIVSHKLDSIEPTVRFYAKLKK